MSKLPIQIQMGAMPVSVSWTPQQLADAMAARMSLVTSQSFALFVAGSVAPTSNVGPWWKDDSTWFRWDNDEGAYVPQLLAQESLGYWIGPDQPDHNIYQFWIQTAPGGSPLSVRIYFSGAWVDVYAAQLANYQTVAAMAAYSTTAQMNTAIAAAIAGSTVNNYPAQGNNSVPQTVPVDGAAHVITLDQAAINNGSVFNTTLFRYVAPAAGIYAFSATCQIDNATGVAAAMELNIGLYKNGVSTGIGDGDGTPTPNGGRWSPGFGGMMVSLGVGDYVDLRMFADDGVNTGNVTVTNVHFSGVKVG